MKAGFYTHMFQMTRELTIRAVESMPDIHFKPPHSRSVADIVLHIVESEYRILNGFSGNETQPDMPLTAANYSTRADLVGLLRARQKHTVAFLAGLDAEALQRATKATMGGEESAEAWLSILVYHEVDHKGNLVAMAKTQGGNPPDVVALSKETSTDGP